ncbi:MAG: hypothetical protein HY574_00615 [candidate division NC10 bacterium]|nr:hypothetical protein [candidate division NC10 bacterium]
MWKSLKVITVGSALALALAMPATTQAAGNPCNPCAAKQAQPCNPCAAKETQQQKAKKKKTPQPCNPCAAKNPCGTTK